MDDFGMTHEQVDAINRDPECPPDVRQFVNNVYSLGLYLNDREFYEDGDGVTNVRHKTEETAAEPVSPPAQPETTPENAGVTQTESGATPTESGPPSSEPAQAGDTSAPAPSNG